MWQIVKLVKLKLVRNSTHNCNFVQIDFQGQKRGKTLFPHVVDKRRNKTTVEHGALHKFYLKRQIEVSCILLTTQTNLGKFRVAQTFSHKVFNLKIKQWEFFVRLVFSARFWQKTLISSKIVLAHIFCTKTANLKIFASFWPLKPIYLNLQLRTLFCTIAWATSCTKMRAIP